MAAGYIPVDPAKPLGAALLDGVRQLNASIARLQALQAVIVQMIDTTPNPDDFTLVDAAFCAQTGFGEAMKGELDSVLGKLTTDASVDHVLAARNQMAAKIGVV